MSPSRRHEKRAAPAAAASSAAASSAAGGAAAAVAVALPRIAPNIRAALQARCRDADAVERGGKTGTEYKLVVTHSHRVNKTK